MFWKVLELLMAPEGKGAPASVQGGPQSGLNPYPLGSLGPIKYYIWTTLGPICIYQYIWVHGTFKVHVQILDPNLRIRP